jgi:hypothetical protein
MTTEEYLQTPETLQPTELIYGVLRVADSPLAPHQAAVLDTSLALAEYDVRECWLLHQSERRLEVLSFANGTVAARASFDQNAPIRSRVLPGFVRPLRSFLRWERDR